MKICMFTKALQFRQSGRYTTLESRWHLDHLIELKHKLETNKKQKRGVKYATK